MDPLWNPFLYLRNPCGGIIYRNIVLDFYRIYILQHAHHWSVFINFITYSIHTYVFLMKWCYRITLLFFILLFKKYYGFNKKSLVCQHCLITFFYLDIYEVYHIYIPNNINTCRTFQGTKTWYGFRQNTTIIKNWCNLLQDLLIGRFFKVFYLHQAILCYL